MAHLKMMGDPARHDDVDTLDQRALQERGLACVGTGDYTRVLHYARALTRRFPNDADSWKLLGVAQQKLNQLHDGLASLQQAVALAPDNTNALCLYADGLLLLNRHDEAFHHYKQVLQLEPGHVAASRQAAKLLALAHRLQDAWTVLQGAISLSPQVSDLRVDAVGVALRMGGLTEARLNASEALVLAPDHASVQHAVGQVQMRAGDLPAAISSFREELRLLPSPVRAAVSASPTPFDQQANEALMWATLAQLEQAGVHAFPAAGTLLGLVREGHLLPFDKDLDLGLPFDEMDAACQCLLAGGWVEHEQSAGLLNPRAFRHKASGLMLDLCGYRIEADTGIPLGGFWMHGVPDAWNRVMAFPQLSLRRDLRPEGRVWVLAEPEAWLESLYGDWRTPDPYFDTVIAARNQRGFALLTQCYALLRLADQLRDGKLLKAQATTRIWLRHFPCDTQMQNIDAALDAALSGTP